MTFSFCEDERSSLRSLWFMVLALPILVAAGAFETSTNHMALPEEEAYRSNFSDSILDSSTWRKPQPPELSWRETPRPALGWRTPPSTKPSATTSRRRIELFPKYQPGRTSDFDPITREEKPLIKVFEFGS